MINVTDTIKEAYSKSTTQYDKIVLGDEEYAINNVELDDDCYEEGNIFGTAIAKILSFEIDSSVDLEGKEFKYFTGIKTSIGIEWINLGTYITQDVELNDTTKITTINAMDYMLKTNVKYTTDLQYSSNNVTLGQVAQEACNKAGITLATTDFPNVTFIVDSNQFPERTLIKQVISAIAQISGTVAKVRNDDKLYFITPKTTGTVRKVFNLSDYSEAEIKRATHPINLVSLGMSDVEGENVVMRDENSITLYGENSLVINDNPFAYTEAKRQQLITAIFNAVKGFEYKAYEITGQGLPYLESLDNVQIVDFEGNIYNSFLFRFYHKSPNGLETEMSAPSITKATVAYQNVASAEQIAKRTELIVDKQKQQIQGIITQIGDRSEKETTITAEIDGLTTKVEQKEDLTNSTTGTKSITLENCIGGNLLELHIYGNNTVFDYLYPSDTLFPSDTLYPKGDSRIIVVDNKNNSTVYELWIKDTLRQSGNVCDEYVLKDGQARVIRRINADGSIKESETIEDLGAFSISLLEGNNKIEIKNYSAKISAKWAIKSNYTDIFATKVEMNSQINQTAEEINLEVSKKVDENEIISKINQSAESVGIGANKIELTANDILNLLAGNEINLGSKSITIKSDNFEVDAQGNMTCSNANIIGGKIELYSEDDETVTLKLYNKNNPDTGIIFNNAGLFSKHQGNSLVSITNYRYSDSETIYGMIIVEATDGSDETQIRPDAVFSPNFTQTSQKEYKKNFEKLKNGLDIIKATDIYKYNLKSQADGDKKHIGFVIGDNYKYSSEITSLDKSGKEVGVDTYSMISVSYKAIQELAEMVEKQQQEIEMLKEGK